MLRDVTLSAEPCSIELDVAVESTADLQWSPVGY